MPVQAASFLRKTMLLFFLIFLSVLFSRVKTISAAGETKTQLATVMTNKRLCTNLHQSESYFTSYWSLRSHLPLLYQGLQWWVPELSHLPCFAAKTVTVEISDIEQTLAYSHSLGCEMTFCSGQMCCWLTAVGVVKLTARTFG